METDNKMDFLEITASNNRSRLEISIFLKPITTDNTVLWQIMAVILQNIKQAAVRYFASAMNQYLRKIQRDKEIITVWTTAMVCSFNGSLKLATWLQWSALLRVHLSWHLTVTAIYKPPNSKGCPNDQKTFFKSTISK